MSDLRGRKWLITLNNPEEKGYDDDKLKDIIQSFGSFRYACMSHEIGKKTQKHHIHIFVVFDNQVRQETLKNKIPEAHLDFCKGTVKENKDYVFKIGKWLNSEKEDTRIDGTQIEIGEEPYEVGQGKRTDIDFLYQLIKDGKTNYEICEIDAMYSTMIDKIERIRSVVLKDKAKNTWRNVETIYIYGDSGIGKTSTIMNYYGYENVYRITDYVHPWDNYDNQDIVIFEEFRSSMTLNDMLNYLDGYPCELRCRYANKFANYTKVYITTNIPFEMQYSQLRYMNEKVVAPLERRIKSIIHCESKEIIEKVVKREIELEKRMFVKYNQLDIPKQWNQ